MKVLKITPRGFCIGVVNAWKMVVETRRENPDAEIFMLGWFVHNQEMLNDLKTLNITVLDDSVISRYELIVKLERNPNKQQIVILSAHGTDERTIKLAKEKGFKLVDTTCKWVYDTHTVIKNGLKNKQTIFYLGKRNHPEANASIAIDPSKIKLITSINDLEVLVKNYWDQEILVTNQTTLSQFDLEDFYQYIKLHFQKAQIKNDLCYATQERQAALINLKEKFDLLIVVGDRKSNNSLQLMRIGMRKKVESYLVENWTEIQQDWLVNKQCVAVTSGASTPTHVTQKVIQFLEEYKEK